MLTWTRHFLALAISSTVLAGVSGAHGQTCESLFSESRETPGPQRRTQWTIELAIRALQIAHREGADLHFAEFRNLKDVELDNKISRALGAQVTTRSISEAVQKRMQWRDALQVANITLKPRVPAPSKWSDDLIIRAIRIANEKGADLSPFAFGKTINEKLDQEISEALEFKTTTRAIYAIARKRFGWDKALEKAELNPKEIFQRNQWPDELLIHAVKVADQLGADLNSSVFGHLPNENLDQKISKALGMQTTARAIYSVAHKRFGWDQTLQKANIDPKKHWERMRWTPELLIEAIQASYAAHADLDARQYSNVKSKYLDHALHAAVGFPTTPGAVYEASFVKFASWVEARNVAISRYIPRWKRTEVFDSFALLKSMNAVSAEKVERDSDGTISWNLSVANGRLVLGRTFADTVRRMFGSWISVVDIMRLQDVPTPSVRERLLNSSNPQYQGPQLNLGSITLARQSLFLLTDADFRPVKGEFYDRQRLKQNVLEGQDLRDPEFDMDRHVLLNLLKIWEIHGKLDKEKLLEMMSQKMGSPVSEHQLIALLGRLNTIARGYE